MTANPIFERLVAECGLSALFARNSMARALKRAGVEADSLTPKDLSRALPEIRAALVPFIEAQVDVVMQRIERIR